MKQLGLILIGLILLSIAPIDKAYAETPSAYISSIKVKLKDRIIWGVYEISVEDMDISGTQFYIKVINKNTGKSSSGRISSGEALYYVNGELTTDNTKKDDSTFWIEVYYAATLKTFYVTLETPLSVTITRTIDKGETKILSAYGLRVKLLDVTDTKAKIEVRTPDGRTYTKWISEEDSDYFNSKVGTYIFSNYVKIEVVRAVENNYAELKFYLPKYPSHELKIVSVSEKEEAPTKEEKLIPVYNDILYVGEVLTVKYNSTAYKLRLNSIGYYSSLSLFDKNNKPLETFSVKEGGSYTSKKAPIRIEIPPNSVDLTYNRTYIKIYAPSGAEVPPIIREAKIKVGLSTNVKEMLLNGEELIVFVNVNNQGRGKAFDVNVIAPLPNNFELKSGIGVWSLKTLDAFTKMPVLVYTLKPTQVGKYDLGKVKVEYYNEAGQKRVVTSSEVRGIVVYSIPEISLSAEAFNGTWSNYITTQEKSIKLRFKVSAAKGNPKFEFIKNATLELTLPDSIDGDATIKLSEIKAGEERIVEGQYVILKQAVSIIGAKLKYQDPLGNWHEQYFGNLVIINSIPPKVIVKESIVKVYPKPEELPDYIKKTLDTLKDPMPLAQAIENVTVNYLPRKSDYKTPLIVILLILVVALGVVAVSYKNKYEIIKNKLERRKRRPGGLPKKEEKEEGEVKIAEVEKEEVL